jgi:hypothetical protein
MPDNIEYIEDHIAFVCDCGSVHFNLLKSWHIECAGCGINFGEWIKEKNDTSKTN